LNLVKERVHRSTPNVVVIRFFYQEVLFDNFLVKSKQSTFWGTLYNQNKFFIERMSENCVHNDFHYEFKIKTKG